jgi:hypothetical protein
MLKLTDNQFDSNPYWDKPIDAAEPLPYRTPDLFDQNGYDLCYTERLYAYYNDTNEQPHRTHRVALRKNWFEQDYKNEGAVLNHALLFERKGYTGAAREQLTQWAKKYPAYYRLLNIKPKWGLDFSIDYYDSQGNTLELLHWEYDGFDYNDINDTKLKMEPILKSIDWDDGAKQLIKKKDEWYHLDFFKQSDYKCNYFGICHERWKMVVWE